MYENTRPAGRVSFIGAGPGAEDLITVRGARRIGEADVVVWPVGSIPRELVRGYAGPEAELVDCSRFGQERLLQFYRNAAAQRLVVAHLMPGDAVLWSGVQQLYEACQRFGLRVEIVPGVPELSAVAAAAGHEFTEPAVLQVQHDRVEPTLDGAAVAIIAAAARTETLVARLRAAGRPDGTPVVVGYKPSMPDQQVLATNLGELEYTVKRHRLWRPALFLIGRPVARFSRRASLPARDALRRPYRHRQRVENGTTRVENGTTRVENGTTRVENGTTQRVT
jgi:precorrin-4/cobalt-precorrin-4 C11-methyltransferase